MLPIWKFQNQFQMVALITSVVDKNFGGSIVESIERLIKFLYLATLLLSIFFYPELGGFKV